MNTLTNQLHGLWRMFLFNQREVDANTKCTPYIVFADHRVGEFQVAAVCGDIDYRFRIRDGLPAIEWTWAGEQTTASDHSLKQPPREKVHGRGWAVLQDGRLHGAIHIHGGAETSFVARRSVSPS
jgi:hypothetical protein